MGFNDPIPCKADVFAIEHLDPAILSNAIIKVQRKLKLPEKWCRITHVGFTTLGGGYPQGVELVPPRGNWVDIVKAYPKCRIYFFRYDFTGHENDRYDLIMNAIRRSYTKYDYHGLLHFVWGKVKPSSTAQWCSEFVGGAFLDSKIPLQPLPPDELTPAHICCSPSLKNMCIIET